MIIDNVSDFTHAWLHRKYRPFVDAKLTRCEAVGDRVLLELRHADRHGADLRLFVDRRRVRHRLRSSSATSTRTSGRTPAGKIKHWCFVLPIDERTTRVFFLFYFESLKVPLTPFRIPRRLMTLALRLVQPLPDPAAAETGRLRRRGRAGGLREPLRASRSPELNPAVALFQQLTIRKWEEHLARARDAPGSPPAGESRARSARSPRARDASPSLAPGTISSRSSRTGAAGRARWCGAR